MKANYDLPKHVSEFLSVYLPARRNFSKNTISSYCDTFKLFIQFCKSSHNLLIEKMNVTSLNMSMILDFIAWLEKERNSSPSTQNQRLACIHSFVKYARIDKPEFFFEAQRILSIPYKKKIRATISYLSYSEIELIFAQIDTSTQSGRRDLTLLKLLYDTACRVQEISNLKVANIRLAPPAQISVIGKGNKARIIPIMKSTADLLQHYLKENLLNCVSNREKPLFCNAQNFQLGRAGICYILKKYFEIAKAQNSSFPESISPHMLRHSKAMHLLEADVNIIYIKDILGHVDVSTTEIYAKANLEMKRIALAKLEKSDYSTQPFWLNDSNLLSWLNNFGKSL